MSKTNKQSFHAPYMSHGTSRTRCPQDTVQRKAPFHEIERIVETLQITQWQKQTVQSNGSNTMRYGEQGVNGCMCQERYQQLPTPDDEACAGRRKSHCVDRLEVGIGKRVLGECRVLRGQHACD